jgi:hypothetical protein
VAILTEKKTWRRERPPRETRHASDLTPEEQGHVKRALRTLRQREGGWEKLSAIIRTTKASLTSYVAAKGRPTAGVALRAARLAGVPLEELLAGRWPAEGACPCCGRGP